MQIATAGSVRIELDDHGRTREVALHDPTRASLTPALVWAKQAYLDDGASLVVLAGRRYDVGDYVDDREKSPIEVHQPPRCLTLSDATGS